MALLNRPDDLGLGGWALGVQAGTVVAAGPAEEVLAGRVREADAAQRVLISADPQAPLLVLAMARGTLEAMIRRQAANSVRDAA